MKSIIMKTYFTYFVLVFAFLSPLLLAQPSFASNQASEYLCELGAAFYAQGKTEEALGEFNKALIADPDNQRAKAFVDKIFQQFALREDAAGIPEYDGSLPAAGPAAVLSKEEAMEKELARLKERNINSAYLYGYPNLMPPETKQAHVGPLR